MDVVNFTDYKFKSWAAIMRNAVHLCFRLVRRIKSSIR